MPRNIILSPFLRQCFVTTTVGINIIGHGALAGYPAVLLPQFYQPGSDIVSNKTFDSWIASIFAVTLLLGSCMVPGIMDRFGRKMVHYIVCVFAGSSWIITFLAPNVEVILFARIIAGLSFGMILTLRSILIGEYTSPKNRGAFLTTVSLTQGFGVFFVHSIGSVLSWRYTALICFFLHLTSFIMTIFIPESPSWLVYRKRFDESRKVFHWLRGDTENQEIEAVIKAKLDLDELNKNKKVDVISNIRKPEFYKPIILMSHVYLIAQFSGSPVTASYATTIIKLIMNPTVNADVWMVALDIERIVVNTLAIFIIHKVKRRIMVTATVGLCIFSLLALAGYVYSKEFGLLTEDILWIPGFLMVLHFLSISLGMVPLPSVIAGEVYPLQYRNIAGTFSVVSISVGMFAVLQTFSFLVESISISGAYVLYAGILTYCLIMVLYLLPETKGRTLQDIEDEFRGKITVMDKEETQAFKCNTYEMNQNINDQQNHHNV